ncbi:MAG: hypothetical protein O7C59_05780, partial [Rickettsia endosymbiont of Ixodes persulcatus]|nr:hypothetical protein [Rickettsia endosymbiont of Ixodes persulcatus]
LDYHSMLFPLKITDILEVVIYKGRIDDKSVPSEYDYLMVGKCYKYTKSGDKNFYCISFGGLLLKVESEDDIDLCDFDDVGLACKKI